MLALQKDFPLMEGIRPKSKKITFMFFIIFLALISGCGESDELSNNNMLDTMESTLDCGPHGEVHDQHCHCDSGYSLSEDERSCVADEHDHEHNDQHDHNSEDEDEHDDQHNHNDEHDHDHNGSDQHRDSLFENAEITGLTAIAEDGTRVWNILAKQDSSTLSLEIYEAFGGPSSPGTIDISEAETNYATCGTCIVVRTGCEAHGDHVHCAKTFMPKLGGQVHLDKLGKMVGEQVSGALINIEFQEVSISTNYQTELIEDGESMSLSEWSFDIRLETLSNDEQECGGHGDLHGDHCHCDSGYRVDPNDPSQCIEME